MEEIEKIMKNLEKLMAKDFDFINAGRIVLVADSRKLNVDMVNSICHKLSIQTNHITKDELEEIIELIELKLDYEVPKLKRITDWLKTVV